MPPPAGPRQHAVPHRWVGGVRAAPQVRAARKCGCTSLRMNPSECRLGCLIDAAGGSRQQPSPGPTPAAPPPCPTPCTLCRLLAGGRLGVGLPRVCCRLHFLCRHGACPSRVGAAPAPAPATRLALQLAGRGSGDGAQGRRRAGAQTAISACKRACNALLACPLHRLRWCPPRSACCGRRLETSTASMREWTGGLACGAATWG